MKKWPVKRQLYFIASVPALLVLFALMLFFYSVFERMYKENEERNKEVIASLVPSYMRISNKPIDYLHEKYNQTLKKHSLRLREYVTDVDNPDELNLKEISNELFPDDNQNLDIYLINRDGIVTNTTFSPDSGLNLFSYGTEHRSVYQQVMQVDTFWVFAPIREQHSGRFRMFTYMPDEKKRFMIELGAYTPEVDSVVAYIERNTDRIVKLYPEISDIGILYGLDKVMYLNNKVNPTELDVKMFNKAIVSKGSEAIVVSTSNFEIHYVHVPKEELSQLAETVLVLKYDKTVYQRHLGGLLRRSMVVVALLVLIVFVLVLVNSKWMLKPINNLVGVVRSIEKGNWSVRAQSEGSSEIQFLSRRINNMADQIQESYQKLEQKVSQRTETINLKNKELEEQKHELEQQNINLNEAFQRIEHQKQDIVAGIRAAERLQRIILPKENDLFQLLNAAFIVNLPKDYVSGDFYWATELGGKAVVALGDCTGHGVSGGILSILGNEIFNKTVKAQELVEPHRILEAVDEGLKRMLNHKSTLHYKDGMDLSVCVIDKENMVLEYATANSRMYFARNKNVEELKGDKHSIGDDVIARSSSKFQKFSIELHKGDMIYLTSDGFADQFGGENNKKFTRKKLRLLLSDMSARPITLQKLMAVSQFEDWKGNNFQVDDVLMIGVRI